jgi:hypothetical protein
VEELLCLSALHCTARGWGWVGCLGVDSIVWGGLDGWSQLDGLGLTRWLGLLSDLVDWADKVA